MEGRCRYTWTVDRSPVRECRSNQVARGDTPNDALVRIIGGKLRHPRLECAAHFHAGKDAGRGKNARCVPDGTAGACTPGRRCGRNSDIEKPGNVQRTSRRFPSVPSSDVLLGQPKSSVLVTGGINCSRSLCVAILYPGISRAPPLAIPSEILDRLDCCIDSWIEDRK